MKKTLLTLLLTLTLSFSATQIGYTEPTESDKPFTELVSEQTNKIQKQMYDPVVNIQSNLGSCTGTIIISDNFSEIPNEIMIRTLILTAKHCVNPNEPYMFVTKDVYSNENTLITSNVMPAKLLKYSDVTDLALIELEDHQNVYPTAKISESTVPYKFGQKVWAVGYPFHGSMIVTEGTIGRIEYIPNSPETFSDLTENFGDTNFIKDKEFLRSTASIGPGSSGGPIFVQNENYDYVLVGVASMVIDKEDFTGLYVHVKQIWGFLLGTQ